MGQRRVGAAVACAAAAVTLVLAPSGAEAKQGGGYAGAWASVDTDGSNQTLWVKGSGNGAYGMKYHDDDATTCGHVPADLNGSGHVYGETLVLKGSLVCHPGGSRFHGVIGVSYVYDSETDTLVDDAGVVWSRVS